MARLILFSFVIVVNLLASAYQRRQRFLRYTRYVSLLRGNVRRVDDIVAATGLRRKVVEKDLRKLAKKGKDIFRGAYFNEATQEICLASPVAPAPTNAPAPWNNAAPTNAPAAWNNAAPTNAPAAWNNAAPTNAPAAWNNAAPTNVPAAWNNAAPANTPAARWNNAPANAPAQPVASWNNAAPANAPTQPVAPRNVVCSACGASVTLVGDKRVCEYCGSPLN